MRRAERARRNGQTVVATQPLCEPEVRNERSSFGAIEQNVSRFKIAMEDSVFVSVMNRACDSRYQFRCVARVRAIIRHAFAQSTSGREAHAVKGGSLDLSRFVDRKNMWMIEAGDCLHFGVKSFQHPRRCRLLGQDHFHGYLTLRAVLNSAIDYAHSSAPDFFDQVVTERSIIWRCLFRQRRID